MKERYLFDLLVPAQKVPVVTVGKRRKIVRQERPADKFAALTQEALSCQGCRLRRGATQVVFGVGNPQAVLMFVGEGPGADEDRQGIPFVGRAGQLLDKILAAAEIRREDTYITNVVKCRPPHNRMPTEDEVAACLPFLKRQIELIKPQIIVCLGALATQTIIGPEARVSVVRGRWFDKFNARVMATFHPAALLRDERKKRPVWEDMKKIRDFYRSLI
ncbi:MAG: uracil-DNA glycosylase [Firmicutes bacterium]|nr:uracil-DNA glycosylase [Bacillota bacterium]